MAGGDDGLEDHDDPLAVGSYSQLLFADEVADDLDPDGCFNFTTSSFSSTPPKMLCFGDENSQDFDFTFEKITAKFAQKSGVTCSDSSSASSTTVNSNITTAISKTNVSSSQKSNKKRNVSGAIGAANDEPVQNSAVGNVAPAGSQKNCKKKKSADNLIETATGYAKVKKEKLGERVIALQQLVSPFGKTDTASVLHEAMGYIRFLQDQVQVLCSPYLQRLPSSPRYLLEKGGECKEGESTKDLRSKGLCLVPVELTLHVAETNGADFWSPAMVNK
ncbi:transcription factor bHLH113 [Coffea arabica]|uniref:Transcription factor bHLH113 n=1 Tax=Coffea arabica TaxID=13443 RepID=A0A6P6W4B9_COFAR|nr:transcription factor bHLH113-like [Coffea arabica]